MSTQNLYNSMMNASGTNSILITGGAGFIGSEFVRKICANGRYSKIFILDKLTYAADLQRIQPELNMSNVELIVCDINDTDSYRKLLAQCDQVVHFAAESHVDRSITNGFPFLDTNIVGTFKLLETIRLNSSAKTLLVSTDEVYGSLETKEANESYHLNPSSIYSSSKASSDLIGMANHITHNQNIVISRCCNNYGHFQNPEKLIPLAIENLINGKKVPIYGDGNNVREWIHVQDHISALLLVLESGLPGSIYNIGTNDRLSNLELIKQILSELKMDENSIEYVKDRKGHDKRYALDSSKIRNELGWEPKVDFNSGISMTIAWHLKNNSNKKGK